MYTGTLTSRESALSDTFKEVMCHVNATWDFKKRRYQNYPTHEVKKQEFELQHCANHLGSAVGKIFSSLEAIDHEGIDLGLSNRLMDEAAKAITAALKLCSVLGVDPDTLAYKVKDYAK